MGRKPPEYRAAALDDGGVGSLLCYPPPSSIFFLHPLSASYPTRPNESSRLNEISFSKISRASVELNRQPYEFVCRSRFRRTYFVNVTLIVFVENDF